MIILLVKDHGSIIENVLPKEVQDLDDEARWNLAFGNLAAELNGGAIHFAVGTHSTGERTTIAGPHWLVSSLLALPSMRDYICELLRTENLLAFLPARDFAVFAPDPCSSEVTAEAIGIAERIARDSLKPWWPLKFRFHADGLEKWPDGD